jgi:hypothetical protein
MFVNRDFGHAKNIGQLLRVQGFPELRYPVTDTEDGSFEDMGEGDGRTDYAIGD